MSETVTAPLMRAFQQLQVFVHGTSLPCKSDFSVWERIKAARSAAEEPSIYIYIYIYIYLCMYVHVHWYATASAADLLDPMNG